MKVLLMFSFTRLSPECDYQLRRILMLLVSFIGDVVIMEEKITLSLTVETDP